MKIRNYWNLRDFGANLWENASRPKRVAIALISIGLVALLPFMGASFLATPIASYDAVLVYPVGMFVLMSGSFTYVPYLVSSLNLRSVSYLI